MCWCLQLGVCMNLVSLKLKVFFLGATLFSFSCLVKAETKTAEHVWWKEGIVYQIYPRSFKDSDGDGVGDLKGLIQKLDYVKSLGVDVVWLNPIFESPNDDNGYDISNYRGIMKEFGSMEDFDHLLNEMHKRKLKLVLDLVVNHSSSEHEWFKQASSSRDNPYRDYYHWWNAEKGQPPYRFSYFDPSGAWAYDKKTNSYYLHYFSDKQPDLNWDNPKLRQEIYSMMRFWFDKGVDGFRMDVIPYISKDNSYPIIPREKMPREYAQGPKLHEYLQEMNKEVLSKYDVMTVAEGIDVKPDEVSKFVDPDRKELNMLYHFDGVHIGYLPNKFKVPDPAGYSLVEFKKTYSTWDAAFAKNAWGTIYLGNHDQPRMLTRWGNDSEKYRNYSSKLLSTFILTMRATPFYYYGDELGMSNIKFDRIEDYRDIESINMYKHLKETGGNIQEFIDAQKISARDNSRTPFQWDDSANAGFTNGQPWLKVNPNYTTINVESEEKDKKSTLNYFKKLVSLRKQDKTLVYGDYKLLDPENKFTYSYLRTSSDETLFIALNFSDKDQPIYKDINLRKASLLIGNYPDQKNKNVLRPYEAVVYKLNQ
jgi:oligo-1,6-glucosidase